MVIGKYSGYMSPLVMVVYVHIMESLASGRYRPEFTKLPEEVTPELLDYLGIDLHINKVNDSLYRFETGAGAQGTKTLWADLTSCVSDLCRLSLSLYNGNEVHNVLGITIRHLNKIRDGANIRLADAEHYLDLSDIELDFRINGHPYSAYWRHVKDLITQGRFDPKLRLFNADLNMGKHCFGNVLPKVKQLLEVKEVEQDSWEVVNVT